MSKELEQQLVAAMFADNSITLILDIDPHDFLDEIHQKVWDLGCTAAQRAKPLTVAMIAKAWPALGGYVQAVVDGGARQKPSREALAAWVAGVKEASTRHRLCDLAQGLAEATADPESSPEELLAGFMAEAAMLTARQRMRSKRVVAERIASDLAKPLPRFETGLERVDRALGGGLFAGKMIGIAARKKVGKSVLLGTISHNLNAARVKHGFLCLEMSDVEIEQRNIARQMGFNSIEFLTRRRADLASLVAEYAVTVPEFTVFEHMPGGSFDRVRRAAAQMVTTHGVKGLIIDYWQLIGGRQKGQSEEEHLRETAQWFADFCRESGIFGLIAAQVNQQGNTRGGEGLKLACDLYFTLHREKDDDGAWLEMEESRYTLYSHVGSEQAPGLKLNKQGPFFEDYNAMPVHEPGFDPLAPTYSEATH